MTNKETVCAVVVTYNRKQFLLECLASLLKQAHSLDGIYIIDNASTDATPETLKNSGYIRETLNPINEPLESENFFKPSPTGKQSKEVKIHYVRMHENTGGAGGFYEGVKRGYEEGYDWLWLMDDDVEVKADSLERLLQTIQSLPPGVAAIAPLNIDKEGQVQKLHRGYLRKDIWKMTPLPKEIYDNNEKVLRIDYGSFVGLLISREVVAKAGFPDKDFFIWSDDVEYCCRLSDYGGIYLDKSAIIIHKDRLEKEYTVANVDAPEYLWKRYYGIRNSLLLYKKYRRNRLLLWPELGHFFIRDTKDILFNKDHKFLRLKLLLLSYIHVLFNIKGKRVSPAKWVAKYKTKNV